MSELESQYVKHGLWVDLDRGAVMGKTITTDTQTGAFVIALLAILSSLATAHLWHLLTFVIHQIRANGQTRDALFRQQQAILRTLPTPGALIADSLKLYWHWRKSEGTWRALARISLLVLLATLSVIMTWATSISSSLIIDTSQLHVLVSSPYCGAINLTMDTFNDIGLEYLTQIVTVAEPFADDCYLNQNQSLPAVCDVLIRPKKLFTTENVTCPWNADWCLGDDKPALNIDSGLIDLNEFGLNLPTKDRVQFRKSTTCAPLTLENRTMIINASDYHELNRPALPQEQLLMLMYGDVLHYETWLNVSLMWSLSAANTTTKFDSRTSSAAGSPAWYDYGTQIAPPEMQRNDTDLVIRMIAKNFVNYREPCDDIVFSAHKKIDETITNMGQKASKFYADFPVAMVGCAQQYQYCVAQEKGQPSCTDLSALPANPTKDNFPNANEVQLAALKLLVTSGAIFDQQSSKTFDAEGNNWEGEVISLPSNQWKREVTRWEAIAWAGLQHMIADYAIGPKHRDPGADSYVIPASTSGEKQLCNSQRMQKAGGFVNINFFALVFVITISFLIVAIDITLLKLLVFLSGFRRLTGLTARLSRWSQDGVLQLQRRAYEAQSRASWVNLEEDVPLTTTKEIFEDLVVQSVPLHRIYVDCKSPKASRGKGKSEEDNSPKPLRSAKTWATQDTIVSVGEGSFKEAQSSKSSLQDSQEK